MELEKISDEYEDKDDRELAKELEITEEEVRELREEKGFLRLGGFTDQEDQDSSIELSFELDEMKKRQLQGFVGEKIASLMQNRIMEFVDGHVRADWILREKAQVVRDSNTAHSYWIGGRPGRDEVKIEGSCIKHRGLGEDELRERIEGRCVIAEEQVFRKFREVKNPWIDFNFHALKTAGSKKKKFQVQDYSSDQFLESSNLEAELPVIEDFKVMALEVKTTDNSAENLLSRNQRDVRELAQKSPYIDFFTLKIDSKFGELDIPESFDAEIKRHKDR